MNGAPGSYPASPPGLPVKNRRYGVREFSGLRGIDQYAPLDGCASIGLMRVIRLGRLVSRQTRIFVLDWLIDQIVYKLYGLTDEEIAIVEDRSSPT